MHATPRSSSPPPRAGGQKDFTVLFLYPNAPMLNPPPIALGIFTSLLRPLGMRVVVFDTTFHLSGTTSDKAKEQNAQVRPFEFDPALLPKVGADPCQDLREVIRAEQPDLIAVSAIEPTWPAAAQLLDSLAGDLRAPVVVGGVFATCAPELVIRHPRVDMLCIGEGEGAMVDLCLCLREGRDPSGIANLWVKTPQGVAKNPVRPLVDINDLPVPDYTAFHPARFLRPMAGRVYRTIPIETNRGCPYSCAFCNSPTIAEFYQAKGSGPFFRKKSLERIQAELRALVPAVDAEYCYFTSDTFLAVTDKEFDRFIEMYSEFRLPFWIQSRAETITAYRARKLKEVGCHRISIGLEHGNEEFRQRVLAKKFSNDQIIKAGDILAEAGIPLSVNNIIGFPGETRELVFDTIELNRQLRFDTSNAYAFVPFHGTPLHKYCVEHGWTSAEDIAGCLTMDLPLDMPQLSREQIKGLRKTFALYARMPKEHWPSIKRAEMDDEEGQALFEELRKTYTELYF